MPDQTLCNKDLETATQVTENYVLILAAHHSILQGDLELARRLVETWRGRDLDERKRATFQILELAYETASNPPCNNPETLRRYLERLNSIDAPGCRLLKISTQIYLGHANPDYPRSREGYCGQSTTATATTYQLTTMFSRH
jgi:hypothetical protein